MYKVKFLLATEEDVSKSVFLDIQFHTVIDFAVWTVKSKFALSPDEKHWVDGVGNKYFVIEENETPVMRPIVVKNEKISYNQDSARFTEALVAFCNGVHAIRLKENELSGYTHQKEVDVIFNEGSRYFKVLYRTQWASGDADIKESIHCFVDKNNGDILKAATWRAPAKHARGNIFNENCLKNVNGYGAAYLR